MRRWAIQREYRSTYRNHLFDSERLVRGTWIDEDWTEEPIPISFERDIARSLRVSLGDTPHPRHPGRARSDHSTKPARS